MPGRLWRPDEFLNKNHFDEKEHRRCSFSKVNVLRLGIALHIKNAQPKLRRKTHSSIAATQLHHTSNSMLKRACVFAEINANCLMFLSCVARKVYHKMEAFASIK